MPLWGIALNSTEQQGTLTYPPTPRPAGDSAAEEEAPEDSQSRAGATYTGELVHGMREGRGKYTWPPARAAGPDAGACEPDASSDPAACYEGGYVAGVRQGKGAMTYPGGARYEGAAPPSARRLVMSRQTYGLQAACQLTLIGKVRHSRPGWAARYVKDSCTARLHLHQPAGGLHVSGYTW